MKKFMPFLLISALLFVTMKAINYLSHETAFSKEPKKLSLPSPGILSSTEKIIFYTRQHPVFVRSVQGSALPRLQPSDFKAYCFYNCKLLSASKYGLCFSSAGLYTVESRPLYDESWKRQFVQYL